jgi:hypothetical protein
MRCSASASSSRVAKLGLIAGLLLALFSVASPFALASNPLNYKEETKVYLNDGSTLEQCYVKTLVGPHLTVQCGSEGRNQILTRNMLRGTLDRLITTTGKTYEGELIYLDDAAFDIRTLSGVVRIPKLRVKTLEFGLPDQPASQGFPVNSSHFQWNEGNPLQWEARPSVSKTHEGAPA